MDGEYYAQRSLPDAEAERERSAVVEAAKANGTYLKAPNGNKTNLTPAQWELVRSKSFKEWFGDWEHDAENSSKVVDENGEPKIVWHQTGADFSVFNTDHPSAGANDSETPNGIFFKDNDHDIGLTGSKQMPVYLRMSNPLHFANRKEANLWYQLHVPDYHRLQNGMKAALNPIEKKMNVLEDRMYPDGADPENFDELEARWNVLLEEMRAAENGYCGRLRELLDDYFLSGNSGYDGIILDYDGHRYVNGKHEDVHSYIIFDNKQVKSVSNRGTFLPDDANIYNQAVRSGIDLNERVRVINLSAAIPDVKGWNVTKLARYVKSLIGNEPSISLDALGIVGLPSKKKKYSHIAASDHKVPGELIPTRNAAVFSIEELLKIPCSWKWKTTPRKVKSPTSRVISNSTSQFPRTVSCTPLRSSLNRKKRSIPQTSFSPTQRPTTSSSRKKRTPRRHYTETVYQTREVLLT